MSICTAKEEKRAMVDWAYIREITNAPKDDWHKEWLIVKHILGVKQQMSLGGPLGSKEKFNLCAEKATRV